MCPSLDSFCARCSGGRGFQQSVAELRVRLHLKKRSLCYFGRADSERRHLFPQSFEHGIVWHRRKAARRNSRHQDGRGHALYCGLSEHPQDSKLMSILSTKLSCGCWSFAGRVSGSHAGNLALALTALLAQSSLHVKVFVCVYSCCVLRRMCL